MCRRYARAVPAIGVCLLSGIVQGSACSWVPPTSRVSPVDTTAFGATVTMAPLSLWPGECRRITLPAVVTNPRTRVQYELRGDRGIGVSVNAQALVFVPVVRGVILAVSTPPAGALPAVAGPAPPTSSLAPAFCVARVDSLATPGDTLELWYTISTLTQPPRKAVWRVRIAVTGAATVPAARAVPVYDLRVHPNPCNPTTTISFRSVAPGEVVLDVFDASGRRITRFVQQCTGYKTHSITWNGTDLRGKTVASGVYFVRLQAGGDVHTRKVIVLK